MEKLQLSNRLKTVSQFVKKSEKVADIGSDHAYLPIYLIQHRLIPAAIAGEVVEGPFQNAKKKVKNYQLEDKISVRFGNGLHILNEEDEIGTVTICGMGGLLIANILNEGISKQILSKSTRLVLQPNNAEKDLRLFLQINQYEIIKEAIVEEHNKIYEVIVAEYKSEKIKYSEDELTFGPLLLKKKTSTFYKKWGTELGIHEDILEQLRNTKNIKKIEAIQEKIHQIKKVLT